MLNTSAGVTNTAPPISGPVSLLVDPVLSFIKAFRLRGDVDTLKRFACEKLSGEPVARAKKALWDFCDSTLQAASLTFQSRRDFDRRSQLVADLDLKGS
jgi:hypothetical protein